MFGQKACISERCKNEKCENMKIYMNMKNSPGQRPTGVWDHLNTILDRSIPRAGGPGPESRGPRDPRSDIFDPWAPQASIFMDFGPSFFGPRFLDGFLMVF